jgi:hypothetical protein
MCQPSVQEQEPLAALVHLRSITTKTCVLAVRSAADNSGRVGSLTGYNNQDRHVSRLFRSRNL